MKQLLISILILSVLWGCRDTPPGVESVYRIFIQNNSEKELYDILSYVYPDTSIPNDLGKLRIIEPGDFIIYDSREDWEVVIDKLPSDTISIILFDKDTVDKYGWDDVRLNHRVIKRWNVDANYLKERDWKLIYSN